MNGGNCAPEGTQFHGRRTQPLRVLYLEGLVHPTRIRRLAITLRLRSQVSLPMFPIIINLLYLNKKPIPRAKRCRGEVKAGEPGSQVAIGTNEHPRTGDVCLY